MYPRRFDAEYSKWAEWQWEDGWPIEHAKMFFADKYASFGVHIEKLHYRISYSQGDYASFDGRVYLAEWMRAVKTCPDGPTYAERYPALYLACQEDGAYMQVYGGGDRRRWSVRYYEHLQGIRPSGIFATMPEEDWEDLVSTQEEEADFEAEVTNYCKLIGEELYVFLRETYEDLTSEEAFIESCEANEVTFEVEG